MSFKKIFNPNNKCFVNEMLNNCHSHKPLIENCKEKINFFPLIFVNFYFH